MACQQPSYLSELPTACYLWVPPPIPTLPIFQRPRTIIGIIASIICLQIVLVVAATIFILIFFSALNHSSPSFLTLLNTGVLLYAGALLTFLLPVDSAALSTPVCIARLWLQGFGFALLFGSLFSKTHRVYRIFNNRRFVKAKFTNLYVLMLIAIVLLVEACVLAILTATLPCNAVSRLDPTGTFVFLLCSNSSLEDPVVILAIMHVGLLAWGSFLAYRTRHVLSGFNESLWIGLSIYNVLIFELLGFILNSLQV